MIDPLVNQLRVEFSEVAERHGIESPSVQYKRNMLGQLIVAIILDVDQRGNVIKASSPLRADRRSRI